MEDSWVQWPIAGERSNAGSRPTGWESGEKKESPDRSRGRERGELRNTGGSSAESRTEGREPGLLGLYLGRPRDSCFRISEMSCCCPDNRGNLVVVVCVCALQQCVHRMHECMSYVCVRQVCVRDRETREN